MKQYAQYCPVARSLDLLGERWTLLVVRDLLMGPRRYGDLREGLPGIATDLLTARLRGLEDAGYVARRRLPMPASVTVYELTDAGKTLAPLVLQLARLGIANLGAPGAEEDLNAEALVLSLRASFRPEEAGDDEPTYELELDGQTFTVKLHDGAVETLRGAASDPAAGFSMSARTLAELLSGATNPEAAVSDGRVEVDGARGAVGRFLRMFAYDSVRPVTHRATAAE